MKLLRSLLLIFVILAILFPDVTEAKKKKKKDETPKFAGGNKAQMIFINIRDKYVGERNIKEVASDF